jgi:hypothetical protein
MLFGVYTPVRKSKETRTIERQGAVSVSVAVSIDSERDKTVRTLAHIYSNICILRFLGKEDAHHGNAPYNGRKFERDALEWMMGVLGQMSESRGGGGGRT